MTPERAADDAADRAVEPHLSAVAVALSDTRRRAVLARLAADGPLPLGVLARDLARGTADAGVDGVLRELEVEHVPVLTASGLAAFDPRRRLLEPTATTHTLVACCEDAPANGGPDRG